jgi:hypothetical protein
VLLTREVLNPLPQFLGDQFLCIHGCLALIFAQRRYRCLTPMSIAALSPA